MPDNLDQGASSADKGENTGDSFSLGALFPSKLEMLNNLQSMGLYLAEKEYRIQNFREGIVECESRLSFGTSPDEEEYVKHVMVNESGSNENKDFGYYDL